MGWEKRKGTERTYYVMKTRFGNRVVSHYVGLGETAELISQLQGIYRQRDEDKRETEARELERPAWEQELDAYCVSVRSIFRQEMEAAGWYLHRWQWRRGRGASMARAKTQPAPEPLILRAQSDEAAAREIMGQWESHDALRKNLTLVYNTFFGYAESRAGKNPLLRAAIQQATDDLRRGLTTPEDTALEQMLIDRVIVCYHALKDAEGIYQRHNMESGHTLTKIEHYDKATERAQRRYLTAVRELGLARRLRLPKREAGAAVATQQAGALQIVKGGRQGAGMIVEEPKEGAA